MHRILPAAERHVTERVRPAPDPRGVRVGYGLRMRRSSLPFLLVTLVAYMGCPSNGTVEPDGSSSSSSGVVGSSSSSSGVASGGPSDAGTGDASTVVDRPSPDRPDNDMRDSDCDGLTDAEEYGTVWPGGGRTNPGVADTDGDGLPDGLEAGRTTSVDPRCAGLFRPDAETASTTDPTRGDTDGDGLSDGTEDANRDGRYDRGTETDARNPDSDGDDLCDGPQAVTGVCTGGDPAPLQAGDDADGDGIPDALDAVPSNPDRDGDGLCDGPLSVAGTCTGGEDTNGNGFVDTSETDPARVDTDCDGLVDGDNFGAFRGERTAGTSPTNPDTDGDGLLDGLELGVATAPDMACAAFVPDANPGTTTNPARADSDNDGLPDGAEDTNRNGRVDMGELDPNNGTDGTGENTTREACAIEKLVKVKRSYVGPADLQVLTAERGTDVFGEITTLTIGDGMGGTRQVGLAGFNAEAGVAFLAFTRAPEGADPEAQEDAARADLEAVAAITTPITYAFTTWDGFPAMHGSYNMAGNVGVKARLNAIAARMLGGTVAGTLSAANDVVATGGFLVRALHIRRSSRTAVTLIALLPAQLQDGAGRFVLSDLADGSAVGQYGDALGVQCDRFLTSAYASVDILWSVDNSASMSDEQAAVAAGAEAMRQKLDGATVDWRTAVVTSGFWQPGTGTGCTNETCGETRQQQCRPWTRDIQQFGRWMLNTEQSWIGAGGSCNQPREEVIRSAQLILSPSMNNLASFAPFSATEDAGKVRAGTNLVVIFVGDADDQYYANTALPGGIDTYEAWFRALPVPSLTLGAIACPTGCGETQRTPHVITTLVNRFGGVQGRLNDLASIAPTVNAILDAAIANASPYTLTQPAVSSTVKVAMDPGSTVGPCNVADVPRSRVNGFDYDSRTRNLSFFGDCRPDPAQTGKRVAVSYRTWVDLTPGADPVPLPCEACSSCTGLAVCNVASCACECAQTLTCNPGFRWDADACDCTCDTGALSCPPTHQPSADLCACVCRPSCGNTCESADLCQQSLCVCDTTGG